ncbi:TPA: hypothetical protein H1009_01620 [archaeon]|nr:hypothetical protein [Candidatus Naiadarchaeales archaeon SRR2090153.bin461]
MKISSPAKFGIVIAVSFLAIIAFAFAAPIYVGSIRLGVSPTNPIVPQQPATITLSASGITYITTLVIMHDNIAVKTCTINSWSGSCSYTATYPDHYQQGIFNHDVYGRVNLQYGNYVTTTLHEAVSTFSQNYWGPKSDAIPPVLSTSFGPSSPYKGDTILYHASATDNNLLHQISIFMWDGVNYQSLATCTFSSQSSGDCYATVPPSYGDYVIIKTIVWDNPSTQYADDKNFVSQINKISLRDKPPQPKCPPTCVESVESEPKE